MKTSVTTVATSDLAADNAFQPRVELNLDHVESMVQALLKVPSAFDKDPIRAWRIGQFLNIVDGFHRFEAFTQADIMEVKVEIRETQRKEGISEEKHLENARCDALQYAVKANQHHGIPLKRSRADNQRAIRLLLENPASRQFTDSVIAKLVGVSPPRVGTIRLENPEYQVEERIGSDGRSVIRERLSSNAGNKVRMNAASNIVASLSNVTGALATLDKDTADDASGVSQASQFDEDTQSADETDQNATLLAADIEEVNTFRDQFDASIGASRNAELKGTPAAQDRKAVEPDRELPQPKRVDEVTHSACDAKEPQLHEQFQEVRQLWMPFRNELLKRNCIDIATCDLREFGKAIFDYTWVLKEEADRPKQQLEETAVSDEAQTKRSAKPAPIAVERTEDAGWEEQLLAISPSFAPLIERVWEGIRNSREWKWFSNDRTWKATSKMVGKELRDAAAALIKSLLKAAQ